VSLQTALEHLYEVCLGVSATPYRSERGRITGYTMSARTTKRVRDAVSAVTSVMKAVDVEVEDEIEGGHTCDNCRHYSLDEDAPPCKSCVTAEDKWGTGSNWEPRPDARAAR
jgi:hypothetical protein